MSDPDVAQFTQGLKNAIGANSGLNSTLKFDFEGKGHIYVDGKSSPNAVSNEDKDADCTISMSRENFEKLLEGDLDPTTAYMFGKLKVADRFPDIPAEIPRPVPKGKVCEKMCERCPFKPDGSGYAQDHPDLPRIIGNVELGLPFYCHETVLFDKRTKKTANGDPALLHQKHYELCRGANEHWMNTWAEKVRAYLKTRNKDKK